MKLKYYVTYLREHYIRLSLILLFLIFTSLNSFSQGTTTVTLTPGNNPTGGAPLGDILDFPLSVYNPTPDLSGVDETGGYLDITIPNNWKFVEVEGYTTTDQGNNTYRISNFNVLADGIIREIKTRLQPLCDAVGGSSTIITYTLYSSADVVLKTAQTSGIAVSQPILYVTYPSPAEISIGQQKEREWTITQTGSSYVKQLKIDITCTTSSVQFHELHYKDKNGVFVPIPLTSPSFTTNSKGYSIIIDKDIIQAALGTETMEQDAVLTLKETLTLASCTNTVAMDYKVSFGDGIDWCYRDNSGSAPVGIPTVVFSSWFEWVRGMPSGNTIDHSLHDYPWKYNANSVSTGRGKRIYRVANTSTQNAAVMRDLRAKLWNSTGYIHANSAYMRIVDAYFTDRMGNRIHSVSIPIDVNGIENPNPINLNKEPANSTVKSRQYVVRFDQALQSDPASPDIPLVDYDGDGNYNDLEPGNSFFFAIEYDIKYDHHVVVENNPTTFMVFHRTYVDMYYKNECALYTSTAIPYGINWTGGSSDPAYPSQLLIGGQKVGVSPGQGETVVGVNRPTITLNQKNVRPGDQVVMSIYTPPYNSSATRTGFLTATSGAHSIKNSYVHTATITLPEGFNFDSSVGIKIANSPTSTPDDVALSDILGVTTEGGRQVVKFRNRLSFAGSVYFYIGMIDNGGATPRDKIVKTSYSFNFDGEPEVEYGRFTDVTLNYNQVAPCDQLELADYRAERRTFGWTDKTMTQQADENTVGINLNVAGPFDNVSHIAEINVNDNIALASNEDIYAEFSYLSSLADPYFIFPDKNQAVEIFFKDVSAADFSSLGKLPYSGNITETVTAQGTEYLHTVKLNFTSLINNGITLNSGNRINIEFLTRTTKNIPSIEQPVEVKELQMNIYTQIADGAKNGCSPLFGDFTLFDYSLLTIVGQGSTGIYNGYGTGDGAIMRWQMRSGDMKGPGYQEWFTSEFRPNSLYSKITAELDGIFIFDDPNDSGVGIFIYASGTNTVNSTIGTGAGNPVKLTYGTDFTVNYQDAKTYVTILNDDGSGKPKFPAEVFNNYSYGYYFITKFKYAGQIGAYTGGSNYKFRIHNKVETMDYPTSETPEAAIYQSKDEGVELMEKWNFYKYSFRTMQDLSAPVGSIAEWDLELANNSTWNSQNGKLPNSWIAVECAPNLLNEVWVYDQTGTNLIAKLTEILDSGNPTGKFWAKLKEDGEGGVLDYLDITDKKYFKLKATFKECENTHPLKVTYGMANEIYPVDPWTGYASVYNTTQMLNATTTDLRLQIDKAELTHELSYDASEVTSGYYAACEPATIIAGFVNAAGTEIENLKIKLYQRTGLEFYDATNSLGATDYKLMVSVGDANSFVEMTGVTVSKDLVENTVTISLPKSLILTPYGTTNSKIYLKFKVKPYCDFNGGEVYFDMLGEKNCGTLIDIPVTTQRFPIGRPDNIPSALVETVSLTETGGSAVNAKDQNVAMDFTPGIDGSFSVTISNKWQNFYSDDLYAFFEIPVGLSIVDPLGTGVYLVPTASQMSDDQYKSLFALESTSANTKLYKAKMINISESGFVASNYTATFNLKPDNFTDWDCDDIHNISTWISVISETPCDGSTCLMLQELSRSTTGISYDKLDDLPLDINGVIAYANPKKLTVKGELTKPEDIGTTFDFNTIMKFYTYDGVTYTPLGSSYSFTVNFKDNQLNFESSLFDFSTQELCQLVLKIEKTDNPYLCEDMIIPMNDKIVYNLADNEIDICESASVEIGDVALVGYTYQWTAVNAADMAYLSGSTTSKVTFTAPTNIGNTQKVVEYILKITDPDNCLIVAPLKVTITPLPDYTITHICPPAGSPALNLPDYIVYDNTYTVISYYKDKNATIEMTSTEIANIDPLTDKVYYIKAVSTFDSKNYCEQIDQIRLVASRTAIWTPQESAPITDSEKRNWNNPDNWDIGIVPIQCTNVYIPGDVKYFPYLDDANGAYACDNIYFLHGGEIGQPQNLSYNKAHVQLNLGLEDTSHPQQTSATLPANATTEEHLAFSAKRINSSLSRNQWHMLSAPLKGMVSGDFAFGGYPLSFLRKFDPTQSAAEGTMTGKWTDFYHEFKEGFVPGEGFLLWINKWQDKDMYRELGKSGDNQGFANRKYGLQQVNGIIEFPYYEDVDMVRARRTHKTSGNNSLFHYIQKGYGIGYMNVLSSQEVFSRGSNNNAYRFIVENFNTGTGKWVFNKTAAYTVNNSSQGLEILIGNPYMSTIDFKAFLEENKAYIEPQYKLWTGNGFSTVNIVGGSAVSSDGLDEYIAPMQSFIVTAKTSTVSFPLIFDVEKMSVAKPSTTNSKLKNLPVTQGINNTGRK